MTNKHNHTHCKHSLEFCKHCDVVYCGKCNKEWKTPVNTWTLGNQYYTGGTTLCGTDTTAISGTNTITTTASADINHNHNN